MDQFTEYLSTTQFRQSFVVFIITLVLLWLTKKILIKKVAYLDDNKMERKDRSFSGIIFGILQYAIAISAIFLILIINGIDITAQLAGLGILATVIGLALQDSFSDVIQGVTIYNNNFYKVNDIVKYNGTYCIVKYFNARITKFKDVYSRNTYTICNSQIKNIEKVKNHFSYELLFKMCDSFEVLNKCTDEIVEQVSKLDGIIKCENNGCGLINVQGKHFYFSIDAKPFDYLKNNNKIYEIISRTLEKHNIELVSDKYNTANYA